MQLYDYCNQLNKVAFILKPFIFKNKVWCSKIHRWTGVKYNSDWIPKYLF